MSPHKKKIEHRGASSETMEYSFWQAKRVIHETIKAEVPLACVLITFFIF
jgi:hypothetical protein